MQDTKLMAGAVSATATAQMLSLASPAFSSPTPRDFNYTTITRRRRRSCNSGRVSDDHHRRWRQRAGEREEAEFDIDRDKAREALRKLDQQLKSLSQSDSSVPRRRPSSPFPDMKLDRDPITGRVQMPDIPDSFLAYSALALVGLTIFNNILFYVFIKPSVDGYFESGYDGSVEQQAPLIPDQEQSSP